MSNIFCDIQNYIIFLRTKGYNVSFSAFQETFKPFIEDLLQHEIHLHSVCSYLKSNPKTMGMCALNKKKLLNCKIKHPVFSCCYAGVEEYIFPVFYNNKRIICIHISGYRCNISRSKRLMQKTKNLCDTIFDELYSQLQTNAPKLNVVESFIKPLEYMLTSLYKQSQTITTTQTNDIYINALQYINENFMNDISAEIIAKKLGYSPSYLRTVFKNSSGSSLQSKINEIRLQNAEFLLKNTKLNITNIANQCGFFDSNYFSVIFKKHFGISPLKYRRNNNEI
ncbi:MAG: helix-turn-helix transcriptional regulator [Ruminococcaceae bacterium]|nr:helix-turn-helix transcriptional regulator [Oscillospiraceae bacterium]